jgi:hypothetical protein
VKTPARAKPTCKSHLGAPVAGANGNYQEGKEEEKKSVDYEVGLYLVVDAERGDEI